LGLIRWAVISAAILPLLYYLVAALCAWDFFRRRQKASEVFAPPVSLLKPLQGDEHKLYENLASFFQQEYPTYEVLFAVDDERDAAIPLVRKVMRDFPSVPARLFVGSGVRGSNSKIVKLCRLAKEARYRFLIAGDSDVRVDPDFLRNVVSSFCDPKVGAVTCLYRGIVRRNLWSELEDLNLTTEFLAGVLVARRFEGVRFTLGATMAVRQESLAEIGGFEGLVDCAADDHELGKRIAERGWRVELARHVVQTHCASSNAREFFLHHLRWGVVTRHSRPCGYAGLLVTQGLPWTVAAMLAAPSLGIASAFALSYVAARMAVALALGAYGLNDPLVRRRWWLIPLRDLFGFFIWASALVWNRISWRQSEFKVQRGRLIPVRPLRRAVFKDQR
jgi:ceramide glucosyltransferase